MLPRPQATLTSADRSWRGLALLAAGAFFMEMLDGTVIATAAPSMAASFGVRSFDINTTITIYLLTVAVFIPVSGWVADRFGSRTVFASYPSRPPAPPTSHSSCSEVSPGSASSSRCSWHLTRAQGSAPRQDGASMGMPIGCQTVSGGFRAPRTGCQRKGKAMTWRLRLMRLRVHLHGSLVTLRGNARDDSANCRHDGSPPLCVSCVTAYIRMP